VSYDRTVRLGTDFDTAVTAVREAPTDQGFGILTEIDVKPPSRPSSATTWRTT
jgi:uncharacterized protein (DUF302 family)